MKKRIHYLGIGSIIAGLLVLSYPAGAWLYAQAFQAYQQRVFQAAASLHSPPPSSTTSVPSETVRPVPIIKPAPEPHSLIGRLEIPKVNLSVMVVEGDEDRDLLVAAGHVPGTALPGVPGNVAIAGHRDTFFRALRKIHDNDVITLTTTDGEYDYVVDSTEITDSTNVSVLKASAADTLTLITCYPFSYIGSAPERFIVHARRLDS